MIYYIENEQFIIDKKINIEFDKSTDEYIATSESEAKNNLIKAIKEIEK